VGTAPEDLSDAVVGFSGDDSFTFAGAGDHVDCGATTVTNLATASTAVLTPINASNGHYLHRAAITSPATTVTLPNGHYFVSNNYLSWFSELPARTFIKHDVTNPVASEEVTVIQVVWWSSVNAGSYCKDWFDNNTQFYNYRKDNFRGDLKTPSKTFQTTAAMDSEVATDAWMVFAYQYGADDFNHWINGKELTVLSGESGIGGTGTIDEYMVDCAGNQGIAEFWAYSKKHSKEDVQSVIKNLCNKYGATYTNTPLP
jgi:hypothetical protein